MYESDEQVKTKKQEVKSPYVKVDKSIVHEQLTPHIKKFCAYKFEPRKDQPGKFDKIPIKANGHNGDAKKASTHANLTTAIKRANRFTGGVSVPLITNPDLLCIDLDNCVENGKPDSWAGSIVEEYDSYTEYSPSKTGIHIWIRGVEGLELPKFDRIIDGKKVEFITGGKGYGHMTLTGKPYLEVPVRDCGEKVQKFYREKPVKGSNFNSKGSTHTKGQVKKAIPYKTGHELRYSALNAAGIKEKEYFVRKPDDDHSKVDFAAACFLIEWGFLIPFGADTEIDLDLISEAMTTSNLMRDKFIKHKTYLEITIKAAYKSVQESWSKQELQGQVANITGEGSLLERFVYVRQLDKVYDLQLSPAHGGYKRTTFNIDTSYGMVPVGNRKKTATSYWFANQNKKNVEDIGYQPEGDRIITVTDSGYSSYRILNKFYKPNWEPTEREDLLTLFFKMLEVQFPIKLERLIFLTWMKYVAECHALRPQWSVLHICGHEGTGRGAMSEIIQRMIGVWNCSNATLKEITELQWGDPLHEKIYCNISEADDGGQVNKFQVNSRLRGIITDKRINLNLKFGSNGTYDIYAGLKFDTNENKALVVKPSDRRIFVVESEEKPLPPAFWETMYRELIPNDEFIRQVYSFLMRFEGPEQVDPCGRAPMTQRKRELISDTKSVVDHLIDSIKENPNIKLVCQADIVLIVFSKLMESGQGKNMGQVKKEVNAVISKHFAKLDKNKRVTVDGIRPPLWMVHKKGRLTLPKYKPRDLVTMVERSRQELYLMDRKQQLTDMEQESDFPQEELDEMTKLRKEIKSFKVDKLSKIRDTIEGLR